VVVVLAAVRVFACFDFVVRGLGIGWVRGCAAADMGC
jgi:hypothetical protein